MPDCSEVISEEIIAVIPVRKGSKRVRGKNVRKFQGQSLLEWSIKAALETPEIDRVVVSTDDSEAIKISERYPVTILKRPDYLATDTADTFDVLKVVCLEQLPTVAYTPKIVVLLQVTSPLRERGLISSGLKKILADPSADSLLELNKISLATGQITSGYWSGDFPENTRSQDIPFLYFPSGRLFIYRTSTTIAVGDPNGINSTYIIGDYEENINIDHEADFDKLEFVYSRNSKKYKYLL